ncbi:hypothetical protein FDZ71_05340 [bacterium]|nr:MAG: hypothetical protein FDZ71_05340 [bacterium]
MERIEARRKYGRMFPSTLYSLLTVGIVLVVAFLLGGGSYLIIYNPSFLVAGSGSLGASFIYRGNSLEQTFLEGIFISLLYIACVAGMYLIYRSTRYSHSPRTMWMIFVIGFGLLAFGSIMIYEIGYLKMQG